jgi:hypothetical protein
MKRGRGFYHNRLDICQPALAVTGKAGTFQGSFKRSLQAVKTVE